MNEEENQLDLSDITLDSLIDTAILSHGFTPYKRDYFFHIEALWSQPFAGQYLVLFRHCYDFTYSTATSAETLIESWDDLFINYGEYEKAGAPQGYVWATNYMNAYPGFTQLENSAKAKDWTEILGKPMKEVKVEAEIFRMSLVFHDWKITKLNNETSLISQTLFPLTK